MRNTVTFIFMTMAMACFEPEKIEPATNMKPAWKTPESFKVPGKADKYDDYRKANPNLYAITVPPAKTPFRALTEWEDSQALLLAYPGGLGTLVTETMTDMVKAVVDVVDVYVVVPKNSLATEFASKLLNAGLSDSVINAKVHFVVLSLDTIWMIDFGPFPIIAEDGTIAFSDFRYYHERVNDDAIPARLADMWGVTDYRAEMDWEGGNFQTDEVGTCYFSQGTYWENAGLTEDEVKDIIVKYLGCKTFIVLEPLEDGTTHMDMFSKLVAKDKFVLGKCTTSSCTSTTVATLENNAAIMSSAVAADGTPIKVYRIPMPYQKDNVWRTYTNSTMVNGVNLVPIYQDYSAYQDQAMDVWKTVLPSWKHVGIESGEIITWGGAQHCISRTIPAGVFSKWVADGTCEGGKCVAPAGGYDGSCTTSGDCKGPAWVCPLPECNATSGCGNITFEGCCDGKILKYCDGGELSVQNCGTSCGWDAFHGYYDCNFTGEDPSGQHPKDCIVCKPDCNGKECGDDGCGGSCGTCPSGKICKTNQCVVECVPSCAGKECGDDGCGGSCGTCPEGKVCETGQCVVECVPSCAGKECGDDGCGGSCGTCPEGYSCTFEGECIMISAEEVAMDDVISPEGDGGSGSCSVAGAAPQALVLLFAAIAVMGRRRVSKR